MTAPFGGGPFTVFDRPSEGGANDSAFGVTNGATAVTMISAPQSDRYRVVVNASVYNADTSAVDYQVRINKGGTFRTVYRNATLATLTHDANVGAALAGITLKSPNESLEILLGGAVAANEPQWSVSWGEPAL